MQRFWHISSSGSGAQYPDEGAWCCSIQCSSWCLHAVPWYYPWDWYIHSRPLADSSKRPCWCIVPQAGDWYWARWKGMLILCGYRYPQCFGYPLCKIQFHLQFAYLAMATVTLSLQFLHLLLMFGAAESGSSICQEFLLPAAKLSLGNFILLGDVYQGYCSLRASITTFALNSGVSFLRVVWVFIASAKLQNLFDLCTGSKKWEYDKYFLTHLDEYIELTIAFISFIDEICCKDNNFIFYKRQNLQIFNFCVV